MEAVAAPYSYTIGLRMLARRSRDPDQTRRLLALAEIYDGGSRPDAALRIWLGLPQKVDFNSSSSPLYREGFHRFM